MWQQALFFIPPPQTRFPFFFCTYWEVRLFFPCASPDMCFLSRRESAGFLKVPWCKILQSQPAEVSHFRENQNLIAWTFFFLLLLPPKNCQKHSHSFISSVESVQKSSKCCQVMKPAASLHSCIIFLFFIVSLFLVLLFLLIGCQHLAIKSVLLFILLWLGTDNSLCHVTSGGSGAGQPFPSLN